MITVAVSVAAGGAQLIAAADANRRVRIIAFMLVADAAVSVKFQSAGNDLTGAMKLTTGVPLPGGPFIDAMGGTLPVLQTNPGEALNLNLSGAVQVSGFVSYEYIL